MGSDDIDDRRRAMALFRHAVIADLDYETLPVGELTVRVVALSQRTFRLPGGDERTFTERTLWSWWSAYKRGGLEGLMPRCRSDSGCPRVISPEVLAAAIECRREVPTRSTKTIIDVLVKKGLVAEGQLHRSTLDHEQRHEDGGPWAPSWSRSLRGAERSPLRKLGRSPPRGLASEVRERRSP